MPKGIEWLWHPQVVGLYNRVLHQCEINSTTREAAAGALQNITAGDKRVSTLLHSHQPIDNASISISIKNELSFSLSCSGLQC